MSHPPYLREKARQMRVQRRMTLDDIAERLALPKTTVWYWICDLPAPPRRANAGQRLGNEAMQRKYRLLREEAYARGRAEFVELCAEPTFRDFVCLYIAEGYKRSRNSVSIANSDAAVIALAHRWIRRFTRRKVGYMVQYHVDQDLVEVRAFWADLLDIETSVIAVQRKSNSGQLQWRTWRSVNGVLMVRTADTLFRARLQAWIDCISAEWL